MADPLIKWARNTHTRCHKQRMGCSIWKRYINFFYCALYVNEYSNRSEKREKSKWMKRRQRRSRRKNDSSPIRLQTEENVWSGFVRNKNSNGSPASLSHSSRCCCCCCLADHRPSALDSFFFFLSKKYWRHDVKITLGRRRWTVSQTNHNCLICVLWFAHLPSMEIYHLKPL